MAYHIAMSHPLAFAGLLSIGGPFPHGTTLLSDLDNVRRLPLFIASGRKATDYPENQTCEQLRLFHVAGLSVTFRQYPCGDELTTQMLSDMDVWMMEQITGVQSDSSDCDGFLPGQAN